MLPTVYLVAEDVPGLAVGRKLIAQEPPLTVYRDENGHGYGTLKRKSPNYQQMGSHGMPVLMLTDLDTYACPSELIREWIGAPPSPGFLFRVCAREIEAWLLADREAMAAFLRINITRIPKNPESLVDPKATLIALAQRAPRNIRIGLTPEPGAVIGPDYNSLLGEYISGSWSPALAAQNAPSLARARARIRGLAAQVSA